MKIITSDLFEMSYEELIEHYLKKYGNVKYDFFLTPKCLSVQKKNSRIKEGLEIHHIDEDKYPNLSDKVFAINLPFDCQKADRLVYVNVLEHLLLHIKIHQMQSLCKIKNGKTPILISPGIKYLSHRINDYYFKESFSNWHENMAKVIRDYFDDYISVLMYYLTFVFKIKQKSLLSALLEVSKKWDNSFNDKVKQSLFVQCESLLPIKLTAKNSYQMDDDEIIKENNI